MAKNIIKFRMKGENMNRYTNFILTVIAVALIGILFKSELNNPAHAYQVINLRNFIQSEVIPLLHTLISLH